MSGATRQLAGSLGGVALIAFLCAGLLAHAGSREAARCCPETPLARAHGTVGMVLNGVKAGGRFSGLVSGRVLEIRLRGSRDLFLYEDDWPHYGAIGQALRRGTQVELGYANCRPTGATLTGCDIFELAVAGGRRLTGAAEVMAERERSAQRLGTLAAVLGALGVMVGLLGACCRARAGSGVAAPAD